jgi:hypothetical protein
VRPGLEDSRDAKPELTVAGKLKTCRMKFLDAVVDRDQRISGFRELAIEIGKAVAQLLRKLARLRGPRLIRGPRLGRLRIGKTFAGLEYGTVELAQSLVAPSSCKTCD